MTDIELIAMQAKRIEEQALAIEGYVKAKDKCRAIAYRIGGPLNDNVLGFTSKQRKVIWDMVQALGETD